MGGTLNLQDRQVKEAQHKPDIDTDTEMRYLSASSYLPSIAVASFNQCRQKPMKRS